MNKVIWLLSVFLLVPVVVGMNPQRSGNLSAESSYYSETTGASSSSGEGAPFLLRRNQQDGDVVMGEGHAVNGSALMPMPPLLPIDQRKRFRRKRKRGGPGADNLHDAEAGAGQPMELVRQEDVQPMPPLERLSPVRHARRVVTMPGGRVVKLLVYQSGKPRIEVIPPEAIHCRLDGVRLCGIRTFCFATFATEEEEIKHLSDIHHYLAATRLVTKVPDVDYWQDGDDEV